LLLPPAAKGLVAAILLSPELHPAMLWSVLLFVVCSAVIDFLERTSTRPAWASFLAAQAAHFATVAGIALWWATAGNLTRIADLVFDIPSDVRVLWFLTVYVATTFLGGIVVQNTVDHFGKQFEKSHGLKEAGRYIGWLERFLIMTFMVGDFGEAIGFLLAAKALAGC
jgi:hypothetical protein